MSRRVVAAAAFAAILALTGCQRFDESKSTASQARPTGTTQVPPAKDEVHELGRRIWNFRCYFCHGYSGNARTLASTYLQPPPRDFTRLASGELSRDAMISAITHGRPGTAMKAFSGVLSTQDIAAVATFVRREFIEEKAANTRYHTVENGWPDHERHADAFAFATGEVALDTAWEQLEPAQRRGRQLFLSTCITCHDHGRTDQAGEVWETRAVSFPRDAYCTSCHEHPDRSGIRPVRSSPPAGDPPIRDKQAGKPGAGQSTAVNSVSSTYLVHDTPPALPNATALERRGEVIFQRDCAFCHAADGTAKSWIGRFLVPHPRDLTDKRAMAGMSRDRLVRVIEDGLAGTSMPAWKSVLGRDEIEALVAYIHRAFHPIAGV